MVNKLQIIVSSGWGQGSEFISFLLVWVAGLLNWGVLLAGQDVARATRVDQLL